MSESNTKIQAQLAAFKASWTFTRALSCDLLDCLSEETLLWTPGEKLGPFWKQFRHLGRVQENYLDAIDSGVVKFTPVGASYVSGNIRKGGNGDSDKQALRQYMDDLDKRLYERLESGTLPDKIDWFGEPIDLVAHLFRLDSHEVLHHGQWIVYCQLRNQTFPESWSIWGLS